MANYLLVTDWRPYSLVSGDTKPTGFDNIPSSLCLDVGELTYEQAAPIWKTFAQAQYPERVTAYVKAMRERAYLSAGITKEDLAVALWEAQFEGKTTAAAAIQAKRAAIKAIDFLL